MRLDLFLGTISVSAIWYHMHENYLAMRCNHTLVIEAPILASQIFLMSYEYATHLTSSNVTAAYTLCSSGSCVKLFAREDGHVPLRYKLKYFSFVALSP